MTEIEILMGQIEDKVDQLKGAVVIGNMDHIQYQRVCGEIRGLLTAKGYILDLKDRMEKMDE
jgi:uncharacterized protein YaaR (DUF327 family)